MASAGTRGARADHPRTCGEQLTIPLLNHLTTDHPRVCGEQDGVEDEMKLGDGSSPRVWGTALIHWLPLRRARIIPACVGNRIRSGRNNLQCSDHPRVCGEQTNFT